MASMKRYGADVAALALAGLLVAGFSSESPRGLDDEGARAEAAAYLSAEPQHVAWIDGQWVVTGGGETARLDASGNLVEIEFAAP